MTKSQSATSILWGQVVGLATVQGAITLTWVIYNLYLVTLLTDLGFPKPLATGLLIIENLLAMVMEPLMGSFADRVQHRVGTRFPFIMVGVILAAGCFLAIPIAALGGVGPLLRWLLPLMMVAWALAMTVFRSPAMSLLGRYALRTELPLAASILTLVGGVSGAMGPLANQWILSLGPLVAFSLGSIVLLVAATALRWAGPNQTVQMAPGDNAPTLTPLPSLPWRNLALIFGAGAGITLGFRLLMTTFPRVLKAQVPDANVGLTMGAIFIALALAALPTGKLAVRLGNGRAMILGLAIMAALAAIMVSVQQAGVGLLLALLFGAAFSLVANGTIPFALTLVPADRAGLGTGLYFSGGALATSAFGSFFKGDSLSLGGGSLLAALAFLLAGVFIGLAASGSTWRPSNEDLEGN
jgi:Na+/melibiose symporter-like transporter